MKIQIIFINNTRIFNTKYKIDYTAFDSPMSLDMYDVNIILLQDETIWKNNGSESSTVNRIRDFKSLKTMIGESSKSINIICYPSNYTFEYHYDRNAGRYLYSYKLKDRIKTLGNIIAELHPYNIELLYENSETICGNTIFGASFYFKYYGKDILTKSNISRKITTVSMSSKLILTTLNIASKPEGIEDFLEAIGVDVPKLSYPQWLKDIDFADDREQQEKIDQNEQKIIELKEEIDAARERLNSNLKYKGILSTNGNDLVMVVFDILEQIMDYNLSDFKDEGKEDFIIKLSDISFIGEIKGVTSNVKSEHVSQLDVHYHGYMDRLQEESLKEDVKALLIINPFKSKPLSERDNIHEIQINLAKRNKSLIITTEVLLKIFEMFLAGEISTERVIEVFKNKSGILTMGDL